MDVNLSTTVSETEKQSTTVRIGKKRGRPRKDERKVYQKKEIKKKRGPKPIYTTEEQKEERRQELLNYYKSYYEEHKEELKKKSYTNYKNNLDKIREIKMKENPDFKPRIRKREIIEYYTSADENTSADDNTSTDEEQC